MSDEVEDQPTHLLRSFGRRRGRTLSPRQRRLIDEVLPRVAVVPSAHATTDPKGLFGRSVSAVWLEIGFGGAEHLLWQARANPDIGVIGAEPFEDGVVKALAGVEAGGLDNVRLHGDDARPLIDWLPRASIDRAFVLFPDPWPKKRHAKRRLVGDDLLGQLGRVMAPGGELRLATDIGVYARAMLCAVRRQGNFFWLAEGPADWRARPEDWPQTRYERKAIAAGRAPTFLRFRKI